MRPFASRLALLALFTASGCTGTSGLAPASTKLKLAFSNLAPLTRDQGHYTLWVGSAAGKAFLVSANGALFSLDGTAWDGMTSVPISAQSLSQVFVTLQAPGSTDDKPSKQEFLRGSFANGAATLSVSAPFDPGSLATASGSYVLNDASTPDTTDSNGVCFMNQYRQAGLQLPVPPSGWEYETWITLSGHMLPLGKFVDPTGPDDWNGFSLHVPPFPGEDFNQNLPAGIPTGFNQPDLRGSQLLVSVEAASLQHEETYPSPIRVFSATVSADATQNQSYAMQNVASAGLPSGTALIATN